MVNNAAHRYSAMDTDSQMLSANLPLRIPNDSHTSDKSNAEKTKDGKYIL